MSELFGGIWEWLSHSSAPAWVQAVGSVAAICVAIWLAGRQKRDEAERQELERLINARSCAMNLLFEATDSPGGKNFPRAFATFKVSSLEQDRWIDESKTTFDEFALYVPGIALTGEIYRAFMGEVEDIHSFVKAQLKYEDACKELNSFRSRGIDDSSQHERLISCCYLAAKELAYSYVGYRGMLGIHVDGYWVRQSRRYRETIRGPQISTSLWERICPRWLLNWWQRRRALKLVLGTVREKAKRGPR